MGERDDFLRELRRFARNAGLTLEVDTLRGKGSHYVVRLGGRVAVVPYKLKKGTKQAILKDLGLE